MAEKWVRWTPLSELVERYYIKSISRRHTILEIIFYEANNEKKGIRILFQNSLVAYRTTNETYRIGTFHELSECYDTAFYSTWRLFKVINSSYIRSLLEQSGNETDPTALEHYSFFDETIVDVITTHKPHIEFVEVI
jgi:hypothetical protein